MNITTEMETLIYPSSMRIARVQSPSHSFSEGNSEFVIRSFELSLFLRLKDCASRNATREGTAICGEKVQKKGIQ